MTNYQFNKRMIWVLQQTKPHTVKEFNEKFGAGEYEIFGAILFERGLDYTWTTKDRHGAKLKQRDQTAEEYQTEENWRNFQAGDMK